jgi:hypothetical protein
VLVPQAGLTTKRVPSYCTAASTRNSLERSDAEKPQNVIVCALHNLT